MASRQEDSLVNRHSILPSAALVWSTQLAAVAMTIKAARRAHDWDGLITSGAFAMSNDEKSDFWRTGGNGKRLRSIGK